MTTGAWAERRRWQVTVAAVVATLVVANVMSNRVLPAWAYVPWAVVVAVVLVALARRVVTVQQMGFTEWRRGAAWGLVLFVLTVVVLLVGVAMPAFDDLYSDRRVSEGTIGWLYHAGVRIPFGTVLLEETAFRAVLPALFAVRWGVMRGSVAASVCFGVWHVLPALELTEVNPMATRLFGTGPAGVAMAVVFAVVSTAFVGIWWCWIRYRARSVLATIIAHVASNSVAYTVAWVITS